MTSRDMFDERHRMRRSCYMFDGWKNVSVSFVSLPMCFSSHAIRYIYIYIYYVYGSFLSVSQIESKQSTHNLSCIQALVRYLCLLLHTCSAYVFFAYAWALFFHTYLLCNPSEWWKLSRSNGLIRTLWFINNITTVLPSNAHNSGYRTLQKLSVEVGKFSATSCEGYDSIYCGFIECSC